MLDYTALDQNMTGANTSGQSATPVAVCSLANQSAWMAEFRFHRNFYP